MSPLDRTTAHGLHTQGPRDVREVIREEHLMRRRILQVLEAGPLTIPQIAEAIGCPSHEVLTWVMGMRKYGQVAEVEEADDDGYYMYGVLRNNQAGQEDSQ